MAVIGMIKTQGTRMRSPCDWLPTSGRTAPGHWRRKPPPSAAQSVSFSSFSWTSECSEWKWCWGKTWCPRARLCASVARFQPSFYVKQPGVRCGAAADVNAFSSGRAAAGAGKLSAMYFILLAATSGICLNLFLTLYAFIGSVEDA